MKTCWPLLVALLSCGSSADPGTASSGGAAGAPAGGAGGSAQVAQWTLAPMVRGPEGTPLQYVSEGDTLEVWLPPQGGRVIWAAVELTGGAPEDVVVSTRLRSVASGAIVAEETRSMHLAPGAPGVMRTDPPLLRNLNNVALCPNYGDEPLLGVDLRFEQEVRVEDDGPIQASAALRVRLACPAGASGCPCECSLGYVLGECNTSDTP